MTTTVFTNATTTATTQRSLGRLAGLLMVLVVAAFLSALATLGSAINWPASLDEPAAVVLPLILQQQGAVTFGYSAYLLSSVLMIPMALALRATLDPARQSPLLTIATAFGVLAGAAKPLGIIRWLTAMPLLAQSYTAPGASTATREQIGIIYGMLNAYAGGLGELVGVALFGGLWALLVGAALLRGTRLPRWMGWVGMGVGVLSLLPLVEVAGIALGPILIVSNASWYLWVLAAGIALLAQRTTKQAA